MPDCHSKDSFFNRHELEHFFFDLAVTIAKHVRIRQHVFREDFSVLLDDGLHGELYEHLI